MLEFRTAFKVLELVQDQEVERWRQARFIAFVVAKSQGAKINSPEDLMRLPHDAQGSALDADYWREQLANEDKASIERQRRAIEKARKARMQRA